mmetsp:Transcript_58459/g.161767  ORF Transcript_58459/g.161767 Transcript_58459/m.161767 type:complete len:275 (-) Transcript_58459:139-963(-)
MAGTSWVQRLRRGCASTTRLYSTTTAAGRSPASPSKSCCSPPGAHAREGPSRTDLPALGASGRPTPVPAREAGVARAVRRPRLSGRPTGRLAPGAPAASPSSCGRSSDPRRPRAPPRPPRSRAVRLLRPRSGCRPAAPRRTSSRNLAPHRPRAPLARRRPARTRQRRPPLLGRPSLRAPPCQSGRRQRPRRRSRWSGPPLRDPPPRCQRSAGHRVRRRLRCRLELAPGPAATQRWRRRSEHYGKSCATLRSSKRNPTASSTLCSGRRLLERRTS